MSAEAWNWVQLGTTLVTFAITAALVIWGIHGARRADARTHELLERNPPPECKTHVRKKLETYRDQYLSRTSDREYFSELDLTAKTLIKEALGKTHSARFMRNDDFDASPLSHATETVRSRYDPRVSYEDGLLNHIGKRVYCLNELLRNVDTLSLRREFVDRFITSGR
jgi:hypothetical protein